MYLKLLTVNSSFHMELFVRVLIVMYFWYGRMRQTFLKIAALFSVMFSFVFVTSVLRLLRGRSAKVTHASIFAGAVVSKESAWSC